MSQRTVKILEKNEKTISKGKNQGKPCWVIKMYSEEEGGNKTITVFSVNHAESLERGKCYVIDVNVQDKEGGIMWDFNEVVAELGDLPLESSPPGPPVASQPSQGQVAPIYIGDPVMEATGRVVSAFIGRPDSRLDTRSIQTLIRVTFGTFDALYRNEPPPPEFPKGSPPKVADNSSHGNNGAGTKETPEQGNGKVDVPTGDALRDPFSIEWETPIQVMTAYARPPFKLSLTALRPFLDGPLRKVQEYKLEELLKAIDGYLHAQDSGAPNPEDLPF